MLDLSGYQIHDLTLPLDDRVAGYSHTPAKTLEGDGWNARWLKIYSHAGTHMDAPLHFGVNGTTIDQFTPETLMGNCWIVRVPAPEPGALLTPSIVEHLSKTFVAGDSLIIHTGWSEQLGEAAYRDDLPRISEELAHWCVERGVRILGVEPPSVANVNDLPEVTKIHEILLGGDVRIVEGLTQLDAIRSDQVYLMALPLKVAGGDGAPARVLAFEPKHI
ncbi:cyclase family protein [Pontibacter sp. G13]|uniref:cyclase family protein n=1 Tax=Pontibacter sp. G13 TaxID=3074898 RepID=UPI0028893C0D|nr:cyclase family protein [Pontibacter sp. G13]WNJ17860.1 cyclase family protein [Pontibacter sp. G13]